MPDKKKRHRRPPAAEITPTTPIWCPACQQEHPASDFNKESRKYSGLHGVCRESQARARRTPEGKRKTSDRNARRWADPEYRAKSLSWQRERRQRTGTADLRRARARLKRIVDEWKTQGCADCGYDDIRAIDPDHVEPDIKHDNISRMITMCASEARIRAELDKCVPRCARCHRKATHASQPSAMRMAERLPPSWQRRLEHQDRVDRIKLELGCGDCGWRGWARGLDLDHVRGIKVANVSTLIANHKPWAMINDEIRKCECVCANCHRIRTLERGQYLFGQRRPSNDGDDDEAA